MEEGELLIAGIGSLGCKWAKAAQARVADWVDLALVDADDSSMEGARHANCLLLGDAPSEVGCAGMPQLAEARMRSLQPIASHFLERAELVLLLTGLGGGSGSGASIEFARQAAQAGCLSCGHWRRDELWRQVCGFLLRGGRFESLPFNGNPSGLPRPRYT